MTILPFLLFVTQGPATPPGPDAVLARIGTTEVKAQEIAPLLWEWYGQAALQEVLAYRLINAEASRLGLKVDEKAVDDAVAKQVEQFKGSLEPGQNLDTEMLNRGMSRSRIRQRVVADLLLNRIAEAEFRPENYIKGSTILIQPKDESQEAAKDAMDKATQAYDRLKKGDKWEEVLKSSTDDPNLIRNNGQLDWVPLEAFPTEIQGEIKTLSVGGLTKPTKVPYGVQIFRLDKTGKTATAEELAAIKARAIPQMRSAIFQRLYQQVKIEPLK